LKTRSCLYLFILPFLLSGILCTSCTPKANTPSSLPSGKILRKGSVEEVAVLVQKTKELTAAGRYEEAIPYSKRSLEIAERILGKDDPIVANCLNDLATLYQDAGRYAEAEPLYKRALEIHEKTLGKDHPDVLRALTTWRSFIEPLAGMLRRSRCIKGHWR